MSLQHISEFPPPQQPPKRRVRKENPSTANIEFRSEESFEESVSESKRHLEARTTLYLVLRKAYQQSLPSSDDPNERPSNVAIGSEQFVYFDENDAKKCFSPDVFVKLDSAEQNFDTWLLWEQGILDLVVEIASESDRESNVWAEKLAKYEASGVREVVRFDAVERDAITVWDRVGNKLIERSRNGLTSHECKTLGFYWTVETNATYGRQLRLARDRECKQILPTPDEGELRLAHELADERRARALAEHGKMLAEQRHRDEAHARARAEHEKLLAEQMQRDEAQARVRAEHEKLLAEQNQRDEAQARAIAEQMQRDEAHARALAELEKLLAEQKQRETEAKRIEAERKRRASDKKRREETKARAASEQKQREEAKARQRLEKENERLRAELEKLRNGSR
jgi:Uma2 family endonuclease